MTEDSDVMYECYIHTLSLSVAVIVFSNCMDVLIENLQGLQR